jgi:hypothetical protein
MPRVIRFGVQTNWLGAEFEDTMPLSDIMDEEDWDELSEDAQDKILNEIAEAELINYAWGFASVEDE